VAIKASELKAWLKTINDSLLVFIDEGGITLCSTSELGTSHIEIGGEPLEEEDDE
jgi:hypothetical protein